MFNRVDDKAASAGRVHRLLIGMALAVPLVAISSQMAGAEEAPSKTDASVTINCADTCGDQVEVLLQQQITDSTSTTTDEGAMSSTTVEPSYTAKEALEYLDGCMTVCLNN